MKRDIGRKLSESTWGTHNLFKCFRLLVFIAVLSGLVYFGHSFILQKGAEFLVKKDELKPADVIVVLSGEATERVEYAVKLFKDGWARKDRMIITGGPVVWKFTAASLMKEYAESLGVSGKSILLADKSRNTVEDAELTRELLTKYRYKSLILVTSPYHSKRASIVFGKVLGKGVRIISAPVENSWFKPDEWWKRDKDRDIVISEFAKFIKVLLFGIEKGSGEKS